MADAVKYAESFEPILKYYFARSIYPHIVSHLTVVQRVPNVTKIGHNNYWNGIFIPGSLLDTLVDVKFEMNSKTCEKVSCFDQLPQSQTCDRRSPVLFKSGASSVLACQIGCRTLNFARDLYWNARKSKCVSSNTTKKIFATYPSRRADTHVAGLTNTPSFDWKESSDKLLLNDEYCNYFLATFNKNTLNCEYSVIQKAQSYFGSGPHIRKLLLESATIFSRNKSQDDSMEHQDIETLAAYLQTESGYLSDISHNEPRCKYKAIFQEKLLAKSTPKENIFKKSENNPQPEMSSLVKEIEENVLTNLGLSLTADVSLETLRKFVKHRLRKMLHRSSVQSLLSAPGVSSSALRQLTAVVVSKTLIASVKFAAAVLKVATVVSTVFSIVDVLLEALDVFGFKHIMHETHTLNDAFDKAFMQSLRYRDESMLEYTSDKLFDDIIGTSDQYLDYYFNNVLHLLLVYTTELNQMENKLGADSSLEMAPESPEVTYSLQPALIATIALSSSGAFVLTKNLTASCSILVCLFLIYCLYFAYCCFVAHGFSSLSQFLLFYSIGQVETGFLT